MNQRETLPKSFKQQYYKAMLQCHIEKIQELCKAGDIDCFMAFDLRADEDTFAYVEQTGPDTHPLMMMLGALKFYETLFFSDAIRLFAKHTALGTTYSPDPSTNPSSLIQ